ncbi:MAG: hypothetical protein HRU00_04080 [Myxococcales bacterium]|nr:hypothetical protein [Myxococcales bacterium]
MLGLSLLALTLACAGAPRGDCMPDPLPGELGSVCGFQNPEDVEAVPELGLLLVSQLRSVDGSVPGSLAALPVDAAGRPVGAPRTLWPSPRFGAAQRLPRLGEAGCTVPPALETFAPHGIHALPTDPAGVVRVAAVGHGEREAVELFYLEGRDDDATLNWAGCVLLPESTTGNDVVIEADGALVVSNYMPDARAVGMLYHSLRSALGAATGDLMRWSRASGWRHLEGSAARTPNGVASSPDGFLFYAETGAGRVSRIPRSGLAPGGSPEWIETGGSPDNLSWSLDGKLLAVVHTDGAAFFACALGGLPCETGWSLFEIDPKTLEARERLHHSGEVVGAVASAAALGDRIYLGAVFDDRIAVWRPR